MLLCIRLPLSLSIHCKISESASSPYSVTVSQNGAPHTNAYICIHAHMHHTCMYMCKHAHTYKSAG